jgi:hypothetical protein
MDSLFNLFSLVHSGPGAAGFYFFHPSGTGGKTSFSHAVGDIEPPWNLPPGTLGRRASKQHQQFNASGFHKLLKEIAVLDGFVYFLPFISWELS